MGVLVSAPGSLLDLVRHKAMDISGIWILAHHEADWTLVMDFIGDKRRIYAFLPRKRQDLPLSATFSTESRELAGSLLKSSALMLLARYNAADEQMAQMMRAEDRAHKREPPGFSSDPVRQGATQAGCRGHLVDKDVRTLLYGTLAQALAVTLYCGRYNMPIPLVIGAQREDSVCI